MIVCDGATNEGEHERSISTELLPFLWNVSGRNPSWRASENHQTDDRHHGRSVLDTSCALPPVLTEHAWTASYYFPSRLDRRRGPARTLQVLPPGRTRYASTADAYESQPISRSGSTITSNATGIYLAAKPKALVRRESTSLNTDKPLRLAWTDLKKYKRGEKGARGQANRSPGGVPPSWCPRHPHQASARLETDADERQRPSECQCSISPH
jgi:hypothetical protein